MTSAENVSATPKPLVTDAMIIISAVIGEATPKLIQHLTSKVLLYAPEHAYAEAEKHLPAILAKRDASREDIDEILKALQQLRRIVVPIPKEDYRHLQSKALKRIPRDPKDWPCVALALLLDCPIWTRDTDYFGTGVAIWTNETVEFYGES
jgi:predicted nucleic acid-binding protein